MLKDKQINYIELPASDLYAIKTFYGTVFGWTFKDFGEEYAAFNDGTMYGGFYHADLKSSSQEGAALVVLYAEQLEDMLEQVQTHGGTIVKEIFSFPGGRRFHFADPCGNELAIWSEK
ncbi:MULTISPECIES: VOC family protein [Pseudovibrio]|uniref:VOC family protein n=1 Tax=Stappiaceae TaxID=2821832 RepID=UPI002365CFF1|nr:MULTISPECIES: VOC family protein [Pseudovibrio]MDD7911678.1 VOC family protein [Pseudovibrio exalbescens]MDX5594411.1 VOC family protein [Pseudovibrio sp. SPO723]